MPTTAMVLMACLAGTLAHAGQPTYKLTVSLLDKANDGYLNYAAAETLASRMFDAIGISLEWAKGKPADESSRPPILIEMVTRTPTSLLPGSLAYAVPGEGSHITVTAHRSH